MRAILRRGERVGRRHRYGLVLLATAVALVLGSLAAFAVHRTAETWRGWWNDPRARRLRLAAAASALAPVLLGLAVVARPLRALGADPVAFLVRRFYSQERLAATFVNDPSRPLPLAVSR